MNAGDQEILEHYVRTRKKTLELFEKVPPEWLARTPPGEKMTVGWLFMHIADGPDWWMEHCMSDGKGWRYPGSGPFDQQTVRRGMTASLARVLEFFQTDDGQRLDIVFELPAEKSEGEGRWSGRNRILYLADHEVHHRAKLVLAFRQWGMSDFPFMPF